MSLFVGFDFDGTPESTYPTLLKRIPFALASCTATADCGLLYRHHHPCTYLQNIAPRYTKKSTRQCFRTTSKQGTHERLPPCHRILYSEDALLPTSPHESGWQGFLSIDERCSKVRVLSSFAVRTYVSHEYLTKQYQYGMYVLEVDDQLPGTTLYQVRRET